MKINWKSLLICIALPLGVGGLSALLTMGAMESFGELNKPPLSPPAILFPIVWTVLYILMGISSYLVLRGGGSESDTVRALSLYGAQLFFNFFWSIIFFNLEWYGIAFVWLAVMFVLIIATTVHFFRINKWAGILMLPYCLWVAFAGYLNLGIAFLN
ncbi:MAG: tryptophan-rich sensory protein [Clostridia bacterium]|nr:tryptophan-rich sensory protein [Clostridia bacterium]